MWHEVHMLILSAAHQSVFIIHHLQDVFEKIVPQKYIGPGTEEELAALHKSSAPEMTENDAL